jgi:hypothetical protein
MNNPFSLSQNHCCGALQRHYQTSGQSAQNTKSRHPLVGLTAKKMDLLAKNDSKRLGSQTVVTQ